MASRFRLFRGLAAIALAAFAAGCHGAHPLPLGVAGAPEATASNAGTVHLVVRLEAPTALPGTRHVQTVDLSRANGITADVTGAGINGWQSLTNWNGNPFGAPNATTGLRTASFSSGSIPAGPRRIFRVVFRDSANNWLEELWGLGDITVGGSTTVTIDRFSTDTAKIFRKLIFSGDSAKALALSVTSVQGLVDQLLNTNHTTGAAIDATKPLVNYSLLNVDLAAAAIANGQSGTPYVVPSVLPAYLTPTPVREGQVTVKAIDIKGQPVSNQCVVYLSDPASSLIKSTAGVPLSASFAHVTPGNWTATVVDLVAGRSVSGPIAVSEGAASAMTLTMPVQSIDKVVGAWNLESNTAFGYNGEFMPPALAYVNNPGHMACRNGLLYWVDVNNARIRVVDLTSTAPLVKTVAGNGQVATAAAADGSVANAVPIKIDGNCHLAFDENGNLLFSEAAFNRVARVDATGLVSSFVDMTKVTGWDLSRGVGPIAYDAASRTLYAGGAEWILDGVLCTVSMASYPQATASAQLSNRFSGGIVRTGNYLFYATGYQGGYQIIRRDLTSNTSVALVAKNQTYNGGNGVSAQDFFLSAGTSGGGAAYRNLVVDGLGNLYFTGFNNAAIYRVTNVLAGADGAGNNTWVVSNLAANTPAATASGLAIDSASNNVYFSGSAAVADPNGSGSVNINAVNVLRP